MKSGCNNRIFFKQQQVAAPVEDNRYFPAYVEDEASKKKWNNTVIVDKMCYESVFRDELMRDLRKLIKGNIIKLSSQYYRQNCGK
jgi:hypothetical protein